MKKVQLTALIITLFTVGFISVTAQTIEDDKINALNKRVMYTNWLKTNWGSDTHKLEICMILEGTETAMLLNWQCPEIVGVDRNSEIILTFEDGSEEILNNKTFSVSGAGKIHTSDVSQATMGVQINAKGDFHSISDKKLKSIKIATMSGDVDFPITDEEAGMLSKMYDVFAQQVEKK